MSKIYEIVVYTAADKSYADAILNYIERRKPYFAHRLYKDSCVYRTKVYFFKCLDLLCENRELKDIVIVDNSVRNFALSVRNGIPIVEFRGKEHDRELIYLAKYMRELATKDDLREKIKQDFATFLLQNYHSS